MDSMYRKLEFCFWKHLEEQNKLPVELRTPPSSGRPEAYWQYIILAGL